MNTPQGLKAPTKKNRHARRLDAKATRLLRKMLRRKLRAAQLREEHAASRAAAYAERPAIVAAKEAEAKAKGGKP